MIVTGSISVDEVIIVGTLYLVGTPIGNLEDLTTRAAGILGRVDLVAAEDTRVTRRLLSWLGVRVPLTSFNQHNWRERLPAVLRALESGDVALVTDAGMPVVSDPGAELVSHAAAAGIRVEVIPGVSAVTAALTASGFTGDEFIFLGFLPRRRKDRRARLQEAAALTMTLVIFAAPHRLQAALADILAELGDRHTSVCRELTKLYEEVFRGTISQAIDHFSAPRGEFTLVIAGAPARESPSASQGTPEGVEQAREQLASLREAGTRAKEAVALVSESLGLSRNIVYQLWLELGRQHHR